MNIRILLILFLLSFALSLPAQTAKDAADIANINWKTKQVSTSISYKKCEAITLFGSLQSIVIVEIDMAGSDFQYLLDYSSDYMPVSAFAERNKALVAINGTYFTTTGTSQHFIKIDNQVHFRTAEAQFDTRATGVFSVTDGVANISTWSRDKEADDGGSAQYALVCGPVLIIDGEYPKLWEGEYITLDRHPRSAVGITADNKLLIMTVDGRQNSRAAGMDLFELRFFMKEMGCINAMNLDGGGSSALYVRGEADLGILNIPIDGNISGKERNVGNILYVAEKSAPKPFVCTNPAPGGSGGMRMWFKADGYVTKDKNNTLSAPYIHDRSGFNLFDLETSTKAASVRWIPDYVNSYPVVAFDSASVLTSRRKMDYSTFFSVNTLNKNGTLIGFEELGSSYLKQRYFLAADEENVFIHDGSGQPSENKFNHIPYIDAFDERLNIFSAGFGLSADDFIVNGENQKAETTNYSRRDYITATVQIGARNSWPVYPTYNDRYYRGEVAEIIIYPGTLTSTKHNRVESYLAVKYGITMTNPKYRYTSSYGDYWWNGNTAAYTPYSYYVTCIARDDKSEFFHPVSKGNGNQTLPASGALLTLIHGNDPEHPAAMANQYYLAAGSTLDDLSLKTNIISEGYNYEVMQRHWKLSTPTQSEPFSVIIEIPEALRSYVEAANAGIVLINDNTLNHTAGTLNAEKSILTVSDISALKGDLMYLVLNKKEASGVSDALAESSINIYFDAEQKRLRVHNVQDLTLVCDVFSATGETISNSVFNGYWEQHMPQTTPGVYVVQIKEPNNRILKSHKIVITN